MALSYKHKSTGYIMSYGADVNFAPRPLGTACQFRFPRSKKKRIQNKWANNPSNYKFIWDLFKI